MTVFPFVIVELFSAVVLEERRSLSLVEVLPFPMINYRESRNLKMDLLMMVEKQATAILAPGNFVVVEVAVLLAVVVVVPFEVDRLLFVFEE